MEPSILEESFKERLGDLGILPMDTLALGISGGADSMALLHLGKSYSSKIVAITVDHALRPESRGEAEQVSQWCGDLGVEHHILTWQGEKPATRIQREARRARYALMGAFCQERVIRHVLTAHHRDDQVETLFLRLLRGSGVRGLAGMAHVKSMESFQLIRPLLDIPKVELVNYLKEKGQEFIEDPSNENLHFGRVKVRQWLSRAKDYDIELDDVMHTMDQAQEFREFLDGEISKIAKECLEGNSIILAPFLEVAPFLRKEFLRTYMMEHSNKDFPPRFETVEHLHTAIMEGRTTTAGGFMWRVKNGRVDIVIEER